MNLYKAEFKYGTTLEYVKQAGSAAPLFLAQPLMRALGYKSDAPGMLYKPGFQKYVVKQPLKRGKKPLLMIHLNGVLKLIDNRHPVWEAEFLDRFVIRFTGDEEPLRKPDSPHSPHLIPQDNSELESKLVDFKGDTLRRFDEYDRRMARVEELLIELRDTPRDTPEPEQVPDPVVEVINVDVEVEVPIRGGKGSVAVRTDLKPRFAMARSKEGDLVYAHVEGYRTYKEMCDEAGYPQFIATTAGRGLSQMLTSECKKHGVPVYRVVDAQFYGEQHLDARRTYRHKIADSYALNAFPKEMWDVIAPFVEEKVNDPA